MTKRRGHPILSTLTMRLDTPASLDARAALLAAAPHLAALEDWRGRRTSPGRPLPHFDPLDGGSSARLLLLLETPGPGPEPLRFVSRDNPTGTARNLARFLAEAGIPRPESVLWNTVPWVVHAPGARNRGLTRTELAEGLAWLPAVLDLLPHLRVAVLAGRAAAQAEPVIAARYPGVDCLRMPHPSPTYVCTSPDVPARIRGTLAAAAARLGLPATVGDQPLDAVK